MQFRYNLQDREPGERMRAAFDQSVARLPPHHVQQGACPGEVNRALWPLRLMART
jgi:hypothetical protein